jgi:hypothetical protein
MKLFKVPNNKVHTLACDRLLTELISLLRYGYRDISGSHKPILNIRSVSSMVGISESSVARLLKRKSPLKTSCIHNGKSNHRKLRTFHIAYLVGDNTMRE